MHNYIYNIRTYIDTEDNTALTTCHGRVGSTCGKPAGSQ